MLRFLVILFVIKLYVRIDIPIDLYFNSLTQGTFNSSLNATAIQIARFVCFNHVSGRRCLLSDESISS